MELKYKIEKTFEIRKEGHQKIIEESPRRIGVIWEKAPKSKIEDIEKTKYLINEEFNLTNLYLYLSYYSCCSFS